MKKAEAKEDRCKTCSVVKTDAAIYRQLECNDNLSKTTIIGNHHA